MRTTLLFVTALLPLPAAAQELPGPLAGHFDVVDNAAERAARDQAIEATVKELSFVVRPIARSRLRSGARIASWIELRGRDPDRDVSVQFEGQTPMTHGTSKRPDGPPVDVRYKVEGPVLVQTLTTNEGSRTNRFSLRPDGTLKLAVEIASPRLPLPLKFELSYVRARAPAQP